MNPLASTEMIATTIATVTAVIVTAITNMPLLSSFCVFIFRRIAPNGLRDGYPAVLLQLGFRPGAAQRRRIRGLEEALWNLRVPYLLFELLLLELRVSKPVRAR